MSVGVAPMSVGVKIESDSGLGGDSFDEAQHFSGASGESPLLSSSLDMNQTMLATMLPDLDQSLVAELVRSGNLVEESPGGVWEHPQRTRRRFFARARARARPCAVDVSRAVVS